jgi:hypothetical protein
MPWASANRLSPACSRSFLLHAAQMLGSNYDLASLQSSYLASLATLSALSRGRPTANIKNNVRYFRLYTLLTVSSRALLILDLPSYTPSTASPRNLCPLLSLYHENPMNKPLVSIGYLPSTWNRQSYRRCSPTAGGRLLPCNFMSKG